MTSPSDAYGTVFDLLHLPALDWIAALFGGDVRETQRASGESPARIAPEDDRSAGADGRGLGDDGGAAASGWSAFAGPIDRATPSPASLATTGAAVETLAATGAVFDLRPHLDDGERDAFTIVYDPDNGDVIAVGGARVTEGAPIVRLVREGDGPLRHSFVGVTLFVGRDADQLHVEGVSSLADISMF